MTVEKSNEDQEKEDTRKSPDVDVIDRVLSLQRVRCRGTELSILSVRSGNYEDKSYQHVHASVSVTWTN
jgi:hypothetical protein